MSKTIPYSNVKKPFALLALAASLLATTQYALADKDFKKPLLKGQPTSTGARITPTAAPGSVFQGLDPQIPTAQEFRAGQGVTTSVSPDGKTLLVLTSGYNWWHNKDFATQTFDEFVFVYDIAKGKPVKTQAIKVPNTFMGMVWNPNGKEFYVSGGLNDNVHSYSQNGTEWAEFGEPIKLGHSSGLGIGNSPMAAGLGINQDGTRLLVTNLSNDSVSLVDIANRQEIAELDLRPGKINPTDKGIPGGEFPNWAIIKGNNKAYVSSLRDRELVVLDLTGDQLKISQRIPVSGNPGRMVLDRSQQRLFVALDNSDKVAVFNTLTDKILMSLDVNKPFEFESGLRYTGTHPNSLALSPDESRLYVTMGGTNSLAVFDLDNDKDKRSNESHDKKAKLLGLIPTGWYPSSVSLDAKGEHLYIINALSTAGSNPKKCSPVTPTANCTDTGYNANQYVLQLRHGGLLSFPVPNQKDLKGLTEQVLANNWALDKEHDKNEDTMAYLRSRIKHVIYIVKENRTYDQVLGDMEKGNGNPEFNMFPEPISPNHHALARNFVTLDNTLVSGAVSGDGWVWSTAGRTSDISEKTITVNYAGRGYTYDYEGMNRNINVSQETLAERQAANKQVPDDEDLLPGTADSAALDGPEGEVGKGYLWDVAQKAGLTVRNYAFYGDWTINYIGENEGLPPLLREPAKDGVQVFYPASTGLKDVSDIYYREYDMKLPDYWRFKEWEREFDQYAKKGELPNLMLVELPHDHFGEFGGALDGVNTPETQMADNDYALGLIAEKVANSKFKDDTLIFVIEDDTQAGLDHVDAQRSIAYAIGPYVKKGAVVSKRYTTVSMLRTIVDVLGIEPMGLQVALAEPMAEVFSKTNKKWQYKAIVPEILRTTQLPLPEKTKTNRLSAATAKANYIEPTHDAAYWEEKTQDQDFKKVDNLNAEKFNRTLWEGLKGNIPYPGQ